MDPWLPAEPTTTLAGIVNTVPPAATSGWYPPPSVEPTERITPPRGIPAVLTSFPIDAATPVNLTELIPPDSSIT